MLRTRYGLAARKDLAVSLKHLQSKCSCEQNAKHFVLAPTLPWHYSAKAESSTFRFWRLCSHLYQSCPPKVVARLSTLSLSKGCPSISSGRSILQLPSAGKIGDGSYPLRFYPDIRSGKAVRTFLINQCSALATQLPDTKSPALYNKINHFTTIWRGGVDIFFHICYIYSSIVNFILTSSD